MCAPKPVFYTAEEMLIAGDLDCSIANVLYYILKLHSTNRVYELSPEASQAFNTLFNKNRLQVAATNKTHRDIFLG